MDEIYQQHPAWRSMRRRSAPIRS